MSSLTIIKTLPHTHPLFIPRGQICLLLRNYAADLVEFASHTKLISKKELTFSYLMQEFASIKSTEVNETFLDKYKVGIVAYSRVELVEKVLQFSVKGDIVTAWLPGYEHPIRMEFFGEECEDLYLFDEITSRKIKTLTHISFADFLPQDAGLLEEIEIINESETDNDIQKILFTQKDLTNIHTFYTDIKFRTFQTDFIYPQLFFSNHQLLSKEIERLKDNGFCILISTKYKQQLAQEFETYFVTEENTKILAQKVSEAGNYDSEFITQEIITSLPAGFQSNHLKIVLFTDREIFGTVFLSKVKEQASPTNNLQKLLRQFEGEIQIEDYVVHEDYGIAQYKGLESQTIDNVQNDYLLLEFAQKDELYVPLTQVKKITKYLGPEGSIPKLTHLGRGTWEGLKKKVKAATFLTAKELIEHYAKREVSKAIPIAKEDSTEYKSFVEKFPFIETKDQMNAINEVIANLEQEIPMNRLLVGDVGFGKTEVIMRAAFKIVEHGGQVAVLSPTTILTAQHMNVFTKRFKGTDFTIGFLSRFHTPKQNQEIIDKVNEGKIDIVIGTHRLLSSDVKFKHLQLLIVDEEQKFGVKQKEKIKKLNYGVHVLSVSATPIPRTLSLALSSIQDISIIATPPKGRQGVHTEIISNDWFKAANAIQTEISRGGQVFFVHNRVETILGIESKLKELVPGISIRHAHGQMSALELDRIMAEFYYQKFDVLLSTTIIENGVDISNANTMIIHDAHTFGLSQLYQLRGRVGRSDRKAFCYLMAPMMNTFKGQMINDENQDIEHSSFNPSSDDLVRHALIKKQTQDAKNKLYMQRLQSLVDNQDLGAGFRVASRDLEIRGAGNILGEEQHGNMNAIGYALYIEMLAEAVEKIRAEKE